MINPNDYLTCPQAAAILRVSPTWVRILCERGRIPARKVGPAWLMARDDLEAFAAVPRPRGNPGWRRALPPMLPGGLVALLIPTPQVGL